MRASVMFLTFVILAGCFEPPVGKTLRGPALDYLLAQQQDDGGFAAVDNGTSDFSTTCWVVLGLVAAGAPQPALDRAREFLQDWAERVEQNETGSFSAANAVALYALAGLALGVADAAWNGTDVLGRLDVLAANASLLLNEKIFVLGALGRAGRVEAAAELRNHVRQALEGPRDGELAHDAWFRAHAILALLASGERSEDPKVREWARSLLPFQKEESGFRSQMQYEPDSSTTSVVLAVLTKVRFVYSHERTTATEFLQDMQQREGWVRFSGEYDFGRAKTTSEALLGVTGKGPFGV